MAKPGYSIRVAHWSEDQPQLRLVREKVFIEEQQIPLELEWDGEDSEAVHLLALDTEQQPIGTARLLPSGQIGRMAVIKAWRNQGVGRALLARLLAEAEQGDFPEPFLNAQLTALCFYEHQGFHRHGESFLEAGIPHQRMTRRSPDE